MRVVAIRGANIASLSGDFSVELDRPPLSSLGLFAISGPVGAGKSTLLDALTLALYGRTPRLSGVGGAPVGEGDDDELRSNDPRTLVRRGASLAYAEADFTGLDGRVYRARWEVKRSKPRNGRARLQPEKHSLVDVAANVRIGDTNTQVRAAVEDRLGLSFEELCRSVLLAQGGFQGFLQAKPSERGELLEKVTGTAVYTRLSVAAHEKARKLRDIEATLAMTRAALHVFDEEERAAKEREAVASSIGACSAEDDAARAVARLDQLRAKKQQLRALDEAKKALLKAKASQQSAEERFIRAEEAWTKEASAQEAARPKLDRARVLDATVAAAASAVAAAQAEATKASSSTSAIAAALSAAQAKQQRATAAKEQARAALDDDVAAFVDVKDVIIAGLQRLDRARTEVTGANAIAFAAARAVDEAAAVVDARDVAWRALVPVRPPSLVGRALPAVLRGLLERRIVDEEAAQARLSTELTIARRVRERLLRALSKSEERRLLEDGEPCPLCGAVDHPWKEGAPHASVVDEEEQRIAALDVELRASLERLSAARSRSRDLPDAEDRAEDSVDIDVDVVDDLVRAEDAAAAARAACDAAAAARDAAVRDLVFHEEASAAKAAVVVEVEAQLKSLGLGDDDLKEPKKRARSLAAALAAHEAARAAVAAAVVEEARHAPEIAALSAQHAAALQVEQARVAAFDVASREHAERVVERRAVLDEDVAAAEARLRGAVADAEASLESARRARAVTLQALSSARAVVDERAVVEEDAADLVVIEAEARDARARAVEAREAHALLRAALAHDAALVERARVLDEQLAAHRASSLVWWELAAVIGSSDGARFRQFAQGLTLDALVVHANEQLKTLAPRYRLQRVAVTNGRHDLDLVVVDRESGDDVRSTATLSGGESFLVSLALALGLSSLSANASSSLWGTRGRVESLFIDEGFSALDADTLDVALAAFDALRQTGRQIGVISHVPLLVERLGAQVRIIPTGGGASRVEVRAG